MVYYIRSHRRDEKVVPPFHVTWYYNQDFVPDTETVLHLIDDML